MIIFLFLGMQSAALSLLLATGLTTGSIHTVLQVTKYLEEAQQSNVVLNAAAMTLIQKYVAINDTFDMSIPNNKV